MRSLVPAGNEVPALLEQVSTAARRVGLEINYIEPEPVIGRAVDQKDRRAATSDLAGDFAAVGRDGGKHPLAQWN